MRWSNLLNRKSGKNAHKMSNPSKSFRPRLLHLEDRCVPALSLRYSLDGGTTFVTVDDGDTGVMVGHAMDTNALANEISVNIGTSQLTATGGGSSTPTSGSLRVGLSGSGSIADVIVQATLTDITTGPLNQKFFYAFTGGNLGGGAIEMQQTWINSNNLAFAMVGDVANTDSLSPNYVPSGGSFSAASAYSMTTEIHASNISTSTSFSTDNNNVITGEPTSQGIGSTATIGFWQNRNGKSIIYQLNGGNATTGLGATAFGTWLATQFPNLYGASAGAGNNLNGLSNKAVHDYYLSLFSLSGLAKTRAQVMAVAIAAYVTNTSLNNTAAGQAAATAKGFQLSAGGTGAALYNVGTAGTILGFTANSVHTVNEILAAINTYVGVNGIDSQANSDINTIFAGINELWDISV